MGTAHTARGTAHRPHLGTARSHLDAADNAPPYRHRWRSFPQVVGGRRRPPGDGWTHAKRGLAALSQTVGLVREVPACAGLTGHRRAGAARRGSRGVGGMGVECSLAEFGPPGAARRGPRRARKHGLDASRDEDRCQRDASAEAAQPPPRARADRQALRARAARQGAGRRVSAKLGAPRPTTR